MKFQLYKRYRFLKGWQFYWRLRGGNNEIIAQSEGYNNLSDCRATVDLIMERASEARIHSLL